MAADRAIRGPPACSPREKRDCLARTQSAVTRCERCASYGATTPKTPTSSFPSAASSSASASRQDAIPIHPHMLCHACGFKLANEGHDTRDLQHYLGHKNIQHTVRYTEMAPV